MSIRYRLLLSNIAMIFVPIFLFIIATMLLTLVFWGDIKEIRNVYQKDGDHRPVAGAQVVLNGLKRQIAMNPESLLAESFQKELDQKAQEFGGGIFLFKDRQVVYRSPALSDLPLEDLPAFGFDVDGHPMKKMGEQYVSMLRHDFYFSDGTEGSLLFIRDASPLLSFAHSFFPMLFLSLLLVLILTNAMLTYFVSKSIIRPITSLKQAAQHIAEGNLDFQLQVTSNDELGQLGQTFEMMRQKLKESIMLQLQYEENRKELISSISHDLKTPITSIKGYVEGIQDGVANTPEKLKKYLQTINSKASELDHLIDQLFLYSKLDLKRESFHFEKLDVKGFLLDFVEELQIDCDRQNIRLDTVIAAGASYQVVADREHLKRVIVNIIGNSIKFMDKPEKQISVHLSRQMDRVQIEIRDNGAGIPREALTQIFDRFYRVDSSRNSSTGGSGLGLAIAKRIIEEHGGTILADSTVGVGTSIFITLNAFDGKENVDEADSHH